MDRPRFLPSTLRSPACALALIIASLGLPLALAPAFALASFPGANGRIVLVHQDDLYTMNADGTDVQQLTDTPRRIEYEPAWSPDGSKIAFVKNAPDGDWNLFTIDADGAGLTQITRKTGYELSPAWSPNGRRIAFFSGRSGINDIWVKRLRSGDVRRVTTGMGAIHPDWSATGVIAFVGMMPTDPLPEVYTVRPDGTDLLALTHNDVREYNPDFSPDGTRVAYEGYSSSTSDWDIYAVDAAGGTPDNITDFPDGTDGDPAWSPDGTMIVFHSRRGFSDDVFVMGADGSDQTLVDNGWDDDAYPDWQALTG